MDTILALSLGLNLIGAVFGAAFVRRKGGWQFIKSKLAARGVVRDRALETFEQAYRRTRVDLFAMRPAKPGEIVLLGDSLTDLGPWQDLLGRTDVRNQGISGDTAPGVLARLHAMGEPAVVALMIGINDLNNGRGAEELLADLRKLLEELARWPSRPRLIVQSLLPIDHFRWGVATQQKVAAVNPRLRALAEELGAEFLDVHAVLVADGRLDPACTYDGLHVNATGYERWGRLLSEALQKTF